MDGYKYYSCSYQYVIGIKSMVVKELLDERLEKRNIHIGTIDKMNPSDC